MKIWVLGSLGMLGSYVYALLKKRNIACIGSDKNEADITSLESLQNFAKDKDFTHIINCAAFTKIDRIEFEKELAFKINVQGPENLGKVASFINARVMHFSSDNVFNGDRKSPYLETDNCNPYNLYGQMKYEGEKKLLEQAPNSCIIRSSWLFGLNGNNFALEILNQLQNKSEMRAYSDLFARPTFCKDLAEAALALLPYSGVYHFANKQETNLYEITKYIFEEAKKVGFELKCTQIIPIMAERPIYTVLDTYKIENLLKDSPRLWQDALKAYIKDYFKTLCY